ncbi:MAG: hypothetical protein AB9873_15185 [Syntrophobacteraceae bacterium]
MKCELRKKRSLRLLMVLWFCCMSLSLWSNGAAGQRGDLSRAKEGSSGSGPALDIPVSTHDFGVIKAKGPAYHHDFLVLNVGSDVLEVKEVVVG